MRPKSISGPISVERVDCDDGSIRYEIWDHGKETFHWLFAYWDGDNPNAKAEAEFTALAMNNALGALKVIEFSLED